MEAAGLNGRSFAGLRTPAQGGGRMDAATAATTVPQARDCATQAKAPALACPDGHGAMVAERIEYRGRNSNWSVPDGPVWRLTCPVCGWEAYVDRIGLPFWMRPLKTWHKGRDTIGAVHVEDVHPDSREEVGRRIRFLQALRGTRAATRNLSAHFGELADPAKKREHVRAALLARLGMDEEPLE